MTLPIGRADCESVETELVRLFGKAREHSSGPEGIRDYWKGKRIGIRLDLPPHAGPGKLWVGLVEPVTILRVRPLYYAPSRSRLRSEPRALASVMVRAGSSPRGIV